MIKVKIGKEITDRDDLELEASVIAFVTTKREIDLLNEKLKEHKAVIAEIGKDILKDDEASTVTIVKDEYAVKVSFGWDVKIKDEDQLQKIVGERFYDLVEEKIVQTPTKKLKEMALDDDGLRECMDIKEKAPAVAATKAL